ncbi:nuclear transport factor 2 family protein [Gordonia sp. DT219]|uniref:nuclear transport factor 2 family protein n=1 Tax=Gordonia sp. DT219 TaxID=3416658 RepID=UPI003CF9A8A9
MTATDILVPDTIPDHHRLIEEVFARYVRAADRRDPAAMAALFTDTATVAIHYRGGERPEVLAELTGAGTIGAAVTSGMAAHPPLGWSHHTLLNPIIDVAAGHGRFDAQFLVYAVRGLPQPDDGWPAGTVGAQGSIVPIESGYAHAELVLSGATWTIAHLVIEHDLPYAFPTP